MISETNFQENPSDHFAFTLKPKRRCKSDEATDTNLQAQATPLHSPVLLNARAEFARHRTRMPRTGRPQLHFRRVTPPSELLEFMPRNPRSPVLAKVVDKIKTYRPRSGNQHGIWALLRYWVLAFR